MANRNYDPYGPPYGSRDHYKDENRMPYADSGRGGYDSRDRDSSGYGSTGGSKSSSTSQGYNPMDRESRCSYGSSRDCEPGPSRGGYDRDSFGGVSPRSTYSNGRPQGVYGRPPGGDRYSGSYGGRGGDRYGSERGGGFGQGSGRMGGFGRGFAPDNRTAEEGTIARPGRRRQLVTPAQANEIIDGFLNNLPSDVSVMGGLPCPNRPGFGSSGRAVMVRANYFPVECSLKKAVHYNVSIVGRRRNDQDENIRESAGPQAPGNVKPLPAVTCRAVIRKLADDANWPPGIVFDGRNNIYAPDMALPTQPTTYNTQITDDETGRPKDFQVTIKWAADVDIRALVDFVHGRGSAEFPQDAVQALDVALKFGTLLNPLCTPVNRAFFFPDPDTTHSLGNGAELWLGYQQSLRPCQFGLAVNVDNACTAFLEEAQVPDFLSKAAGLYSVNQLANCSEIQLKRAAKAIIGIKVKVTHLGARQRAFKVKGLTKEGAASLAFRLDDGGGETTVAEYFQERYGRSLKLPDVPCLNVGTPRKPIYLPAEVCTIAPGQRRLKLDEKQTAEMIKKAAQKPDERAWNIERSINEKGNLPNDPHVRAFGLSVEPSMVAVNSRILPPPELMYDQRYRPGDRGSWDMRNLRFNRPARLTAFAIASFMPAHRCGKAEDPGGLPTFMYDLIGAMNALGITIPRMDDLPEIIYHDSSRCFPGETLKAAVDAGQEFFRATPRIIFVLLPDTGAELYKEVKRASDSFLGIPSQCFVSRKASIGVPMARGRPQYCANIAMKVNAKLDGVNCALATIQPFMQRPFMVIGTGVTHPTSFNESEPSIAAVVGSMDARCSRYSAEVQLQGHRVEIIQGLKILMKRLLLNFYRATGGMTPYKLILYRDGVSEGMFKEVQRAEIPQIIQACREMDEDYRPTLTFIVCQKRHHTRFFPTDRRNVDGSGNCLPGTVMDNGITHPTENDFYLLSHAGIQGTSRPTHYHVLLDQNRFSPDELQTFTFHLTHTFCRCTRSVSVCPPAYYAWLAATRGRAMLSHFAPSSDSESVASSSRGPRVGEHAEFASIHEALATHMYYV